MEIDPIHAAAMTDKKRGLGCRFTANLRVTASVRKFFFQYCAGRDACRAAFHCRIIAHLPHYRTLKLGRNIIVTSRSCDITSLFRRLPYDALLKHLTFPPFRYPLFWSSRMNVDISRDFETQGDWKWCGRKRCFALKMQDLSITM